MKKIRLMLKELCKTDWKFLCAKCVDSIAKHLVMLCCGCGVTIHLFNLKPNIFSMFVLACACSLISYMWDETFK